MSITELERRFVRKMLADLKWLHLEPLDGDDPPDFVLTSRDARIAVEVTRIHTHEGKKGSPDAAHERECLRFVSVLANAYFAGQRSQPIQVTVALPLPKRRRRRSDLAALHRAALLRMNELPVLDEWDHVKFSLRTHDAQLATFFVLRLPQGKGERELWDSMEVTTGSDRPVNLRLLQAKVNAKATALPKYRANVTTAVLLVVADGSKASGFLELPRGSAVNPQGFDSVYFQQYPFGETTLVLRKP